MKRVLMVCLGNICRSPLAEGILQSKIAASKVSVDSAGTAAFHEGNLPDPRSVEIANHYNIDITGQRARAFTPQDFSKFDLIYAMDLSNYNHLLELAKNKTDREKVHLILNDLFPNQNREVPDPYYGGAQGFEEVYQLLEAACSLIASKLT
tara:strand:- start:13711 stop:14163 length:453 start_codon:yes stop_codon:yes gene_type:complete